MFFDKVQGVHTRNHILEETHYYPFGLTMQGISSEAVNTVENKKKYNGIELENDLELQTYDAFFRELDPQTGRWWQVDPKTEKMEMWSPYASNYDNPLRYNDPLGDEPACCLDGPIMWLFNLVDRVTTPTQKENARALVDGTASTLKQMGANAKANWQAGNTPFHDIMANPLSLIDGRAEVNMLKRVVGMEVKQEVQILKNVQKYEVGIAEELSKRSVKDGLEVHHVPQSQPAGHVIKDYDKAKAPAIVLPRDEHRAIPTLRGTSTAGNARLQLAKDIKDLRKKTDAPNSSLQQLIDLNKKLFPEALKKQ